MANLLQQSVLLGLVLVVHVPLVIQQHIVAEPIHELILCVRTERGHVVVLREWHLQRRLLVLKSLWHLSRGEQAPPWHRVDGQGGRRLLPSPLAFLLAG